MRIEQTLKTLIKAEVKKQCRILDIEAPKVKFNNKGDICFHLHISNEYDIKTELCFDVVSIICHVQLKNRNQSVFNYINKKDKINSITKRIKFIVYHELGHYYHFKKYTDSYLINKRHYKNDGLNEAEYRKQSLEAKADRIALSLIK